MHLNAIGALDNRNLGAIASGCLGGRVASDASANDHDVVIFGFGNIFNRFRSNFPRVLHSLGRSGIRIRRRSRRRVSARAACSQSARRRSRSSCRQRTLQKIPTSNLHGPLHSSIRDAYRADAPPGACLENGPWKPVSTTHEPTHSTT